MSEDHGYCVWVTENTGALLARAPSFVQPLQAQTFRDNLRGCISDLADGNHSALARAVCLHDESQFRHWLDHRLPEINSLMSICFRLRIPAERFLTERLGAGDPDWERAREIVRDKGLRGVRRPSLAAVQLRLQEALRSACPPALSDLAVQLGFRRATALYRRDRSICLQITKRRAELRTRSGASKRLPNALIPKTQVKQSLQFAITEQPPPSVLRVAQRLGFRNVSSLYARFPALCRELAAIHRKYRKLRRGQIEATLRGALVEEPPPTLKQMMHRLGYKTASSLRQWFPALCKTLVGRGRKYHQQRLEQIRATLQAALTQEPPPLKQALATKARLTRGYLAMLFPDIWRRLGARSREHRKQEVEKRRQTLRQEVRKIVRELLAKGTRPTRRLVRSRITRSPIKCGDLIVWEIRLVEDRFRRQPLPSSGHGTSEHDGREAGTGTFPRSR